MESKFKCKPRTMVRSKRLFLMLVSVCGLLFLSFVFNHSIMPPSLQDYQNTSSSRSTVLQENKQNDTKVDMNISRKSEKYVKIPPVPRARDSNGVKLCSSKTVNFKYALSKSKIIPTIYFITPTYARTEQLAELTRLSNTLLHIRNLHWIIAEDSHTCSEMLYSSLERFGIPYTHLSSPMPKQYLKFDIKKRPRGVANRMAGLRWVLKHHHEVLDYIKKQKISNTSNVFKEQFPSVVYFGDDDNT